MVRKKDPVVGVVQISMESYAEQFVIFFTQIESVYKETYSFPEVWSQSVQT